jgi:PAS domain S-box-containing protein
MREKGSELGVSQASLTTDDGTLVPVRISASKLRSTDGDTYSLIVSDMTAIVNAEQLLRQLNDELELKVAERTSSLERTNDLLKAEVIERVITQRQMLEEKETIALALNSIGDALIMTDGNDRIVLINSTGQKITGWRSPEALGKMSQEIFAIETEERVKGPVTIEVGVGDGECALCHQAILRTRNGGRVQVEYGACPLKAPDKREAGMILVFREVKGDKL